MPTRPDKRNVLVDREALRPYMASRSTSRGTGSQSSDLSKPSYLSLGYFTQLDNERLLTPGDGISGTDAGGDSTYTLAVDGTVLRHADVDDTPVNGETDVPVSSNWAYDHNVADNHIAHSGVTLTAGDGLTGGGDISANRAFSVDEAYAFEWTGVHTFADDITVDTDLLVVDVSEGNIGINRTPDSQFDLDVNGAARASLFVGAHAIQLADALIICHFDGPRPFETDFSGFATGHMGQSPVLSGGAIFRPGKFGKGIQIAEATTNLFPNPSFEGGFTWNGSGTNYDSLSTDEVIYGDNSVFISDFAETIYYHETISVTATTYTLSGYIKPVSGSMTNISARFDSSTDAWDTVTEVDDGWFYCTRTAVCTNGSRTFGVRATSTVGDFYCDGFQLEELAYATPYCDGSLGDGHSWSGTAHASTSSRTATEVNFDSYATQFVNSQMTVCGWLVVGTLPSASSDSGRLYDTIGAGNTNRIILQCATDDKFDVYINNAYRIANVGSGSLSYGDEVFWCLTLDFDEDEYNLYIYEDDGTLYSDDSSASLSVPVVTALNLGTNQADASKPINGVLDDVAILDRVLTATEIQAIYESDAPVFAESSTFSFKASGGNGQVWADQDGLFVKDDAGDEVFAVINDDSYSWGGESFDSGDVILGDPANANMLWDQSAGQIKFRGGSTVEAYVNTDGTIVAGGGLVWLSATGLGLTGGTGDGSKVSWSLTDGTEYIYMFESGTTIVGYFGLNAALAHDSVFRFVATDGALDTTMMEIGQGEGVKISGDYDDLRIEGGLYVGGDVDPAGDFRLAAGVDIGFYGTAAQSQQSVAHGNTNGEIGGLSFGGAYDSGQSKALRDKCEELADDVRSLRAALVTYGLVAES